MTPRDERIKTSLQVWAAAAPMQSHLAMEAIAVMVLGVSMFFASANEFVSAHAGFIFGLLMLNLSLSSRLAAKWDQQSFDDLAINSAETAPVAFGLLIVSLLLLTQSFGLVIAVCGFD